MSGEIVLILGFCVLFVFWGGFCFSCLTMHIIACSDEVVDILIYILGLHCAKFPFSFFFFCF